MNYIWDEASRRLGSTFSMPRTAFIGHSQGNDVPLRHGGSVSVPVMSGLCRCTDLLLMIGAAILASWSGYATNGRFHGGECAVVGAIAAVTAHWVCELQDAYSLAALRNPLKLAPKLALAALAGSVMEMAALLLLHGGGVGRGSDAVQAAAWGLLAGASMLSLHAAVAWRLRVTARSGRLATKIAVVGANEFSLRFVEAAGLEATLRIVGVFDDRQAHLDGDSSIRGDVSDLIAYAGRYALDAIVIALPLEAVDRIAELQERLSGLAADIFLTTDVAGLLYGGAQFATLGSLPVVAVASQPLKDWPALKKAAFDRVLSAILLVLLSPLMTLFAIAIKLDSPGPVFFRQVREGRHRVPFTMIKFRTMWHGRAPGDQGVQATQRDKRVTRAGFWLRRTSLDELPQLFNVLRGDMSLVGPRPHLAATLIGSQTFDEVIPGYHARHRVKPGLTGWAQVQGLRGETKTVQDLAARVEQDLYYIEHWSLGFDLRIVLRTILREIINSASGKAY